MPILKAAPTMVASLIPFIDPHGRNVMVLIAKCSYEIGPAGLEPSPDQVPVLLTDTHLNGDRTSEMVIPSDFTDYKPVGEVLVIRPTTETAARTVAGRKVSIQVGELFFAGEARAPWPLGPLGRNHKLRMRYAGTYDAAWQTNRLPLLPADFNPLFNQSAPQAQRARQAFVGNELIGIEGLYGAGARVTFGLPGKTVLVTANVRQEYVSEAARLDTILLWTDTPRITLVWRHVIRPRQKNEEIGDVSANFVRLQTAREFFTERAGDP
jgi:hypothetical protein